MVKDLEGEKVRLEEKKKQKLEVLKEKKREIMEKLYEDKPAKEIKESDKAGKQNETNLISEKKKQ